jgi:hypothetical protein
MHPQKRILAVINVLGGCAVLGSYAQGLFSHPTTSSDLWGDVPHALRTPYTFWMFAAAIGYFLFSYFLFLRVDPDRVSIAQRFDFRLFNILYASILGPSALWMPLTFEMLANPRPGLWLLIRVTLWAAGLASVALVAGLISLRPRQPARPYWLAVAGSIAFTVQTALLDALIWTAYFPA